MALVPRRYQEESIARAREGNTIVVLPTNKGKTLIAVKLIDHFRSIEPVKRAVFAVPTKALVKQQAEYCQKHCTQNLRAAQLCGVEMDRWDASKWRACLRDNHVLVGTAEVFRRAFEKGYVTTDRISLLILDECHHAVGNSPMASMMRQSIAKAQNPPRVLGLTASFSSGALKRKRDVEMKKVELELLLQSQMFCPVWEAEPASDEVPGSGTQWHKVPCPVESLEEIYAEPIELFLNHILTECDPGKRVADFSKVLRRMKHVFGELGREAFIYAIRDNVIHYLESQAENLIVLTDQGAQAKATQLRAALPELRRKLRGHTKQEITDRFFSNAPRLSKKVLQLFQLLTEKLLPAGKGIVFVTQVITTFPLAKLIQSHVSASKALGVYGQQALADQNMSLEKFRSGEINTIVATDTLQEGIDVPDCEWVVRFNEFTTTKAHIQGSGRARSTFAQVYYFVNDPELEKERARMMNVVACNRAVAATDELREARASKQQRREDNSKGVHPFVMPGSQDIHVFNGLEIVYDWCQQVLGEAFDPEKLFEYGTEDEGERLMQVTIPGPDGTMTVTCADIEKYWGDLRPRDVVDPALLRRSSGKDQDLRKALFVVAVKMRQRGMLDNANEPATMSLLLAKERVQKPVRHVRVTVGNKFPRDLPQVKGGNFISALSEWAQQKWPTKTSADVLKYSATENDDGWTATVQILPLGKSFKGTAFPQKKTAQQSAAQAAYDAVSQQI